MTEKPWLILTLRRTGGMPLTAFLAKSSKSRTVEHAPEPIALKRAENRVGPDFSRPARDVGQMRNRQTDFPWYPIKDLTFGDTPIKRRAIELAADQGLEKGAADERLQTFEDHDDNKIFVTSPFVETQEEAVLRTRALCAYAHKTAKPFHHGLSIQFT